MSHDTTSTSDAPLRPLAGLKLLRRRILASTLRGRFARSRWHLWMAMLSSAVFWVGLLLLFLEGFGVLKRHQLVSGYLIELVFGLFFSTLLVMLVFSA